MKKGTFSVQYKFFYVVGFSNMHARAFYEPIKTVFNTKRPT